MDDTGQQQGEHGWPRRITYSWEGVAHSSASIKSINGVEVARNLARNPRVLDNNDYWHILPGSDRMFNNDFNVAEEPQVTRYVGARKTATSGYVRLRTQFLDVQGGSAVAMRVWVRSPQPYEMCFVITERVGVSQQQYTSEYTDLTSGWQLVTHVVTTDPNASQVRVGFNMVNPNGDVQEGDEIHAAGLVISAADTEAEALAQASEYFDGDTEDVTLWPSGTTAISSFTRDWWGRLPRYVQDADRAQGPEPYPLLRFLDGVGFHAGRVREATWDMWSGVAIDPPTAPDSLMPWISYLLGLGDHHRAHGPRHLRETVLAHVSGGTNQAGTRDHIAAMVRPFLEPGAQLSIRPSTASRNTLVIGVDPDDVPGQDYEKLMRQIRVSGIVPAGHALLAQDLRATWDEWESTAGATWAEKERNIATWEESDRAGIELL